MVVLLYFTCNFDVIAEDGSIAFIYAPILAGSTSTSCISNILLALFYRWCKNKLQLSTQLNRYEFQIKGE